MSNNKDFTTKCKKIMWHNNLKHTKKTMQIAVLTLLGRDLIFNCSAPLYLRMAQCLIYFHVLFNFCSISFSHYIPSQTKLGALIMFMDNSAQFLAVKQKLNPLVTIKQVISLSRKHMETNFWKFFFNILPIKLPYLFL